MRSYHSTSNTYGAPSLTWAVQRLIFLNIGIFALQLLLDPLVAIFDGSRHGVLLVPGGSLTRLLGFTPSAFTHGQIWEILTYQFLHGGLLHLFMNMLWLFFFGPEVERVLGSRQFMRFYLLCGGLGVLATLLPFALRGDDPTVTGASGAVMGVLIAFAIVDPERQFFLFPLPVPINARALVFIVVILNLISALGDSSVSVATHFGGMIVGYIYMKCRPRWGQWQRHRKQEKEIKDSVGEAVDNIFKFQDRDER